jgi:hypothetical protein
MGVFQTTRTYPLVLPDLAPVASDLMRHFEAQDFEVKGEATITRGWYVSITKGQLFASVLGSQSSLNIEIQPSSFGTTARARVGVFGKQVIPSLITYFIAWPVMLAQISGMVQQSKLDEEALDVIERSLAARGGAAPSLGMSQVTGVGFCINCGQKLEGGGRFCSGCGAKQGP